MTKQEIHNLKRNTNRARRQILTTASSILEIRSVKMSAEDSQNSGAKRREERMQRREEMRQKRWEESEQRRKEGEVVQQEEEQEVQQEEQEVQKEDDQGPEVQQEVVDDQDDGSQGVLPSLEMKPGAMRTSGGQQEPRSLVKLLQDIQALTDCTYR